MIQQLLQDKNLILASGSPRRKMFLEELGLSFEIRTKDIDEHYPPDLKEIEISDYLAKLKAESFAGELRTNDILITADTIVWLNGRALGKPENFEDACLILSELSGQKHSVLSSVAITTTENQVLINEETSVWFKKLTHQEIEYYVKEYEPYDKAGAYGIQEWIGYIAIEKIAGSHYNVMGFPVQKFYEAMIKMNS